MLEITSTKSTDTEDVIWGLQTADTLWRRGERIDALVWLRRAAQAAGDANDDDRALELARYAAELTDLMAREEGAGAASGEAPAKASPGVEAIEPEDVRVASRRGDIRREDTTPAPSLDEPLPSLDIKGLAY